MINTPIKPTAVAIQRRNPTLSPRKTIDNAVTNSGETKPVADASAIGRNRRPEMKNNEEPSSATPRITCKPGRRDCNPNSGEPGTIAGDMIRANTKNLIHAISIEGSVADRYFAVTSEAPRNTVDARISAMPRNGRSARAGAARLVRPLSGNGGSSSLVTVARRGGKAENSGVGIGCSVSAQTTTISLDGQGPKTGSRYARRQNSGYNIGRLRGRVPRGKTFSMAAISSAPSQSIPAAALSAACAGFAAFGIANSGSSRVRKASATCRGDAPCASAIACSTAPPLLLELGKSCCPNGE